jgi:hypothetical protein
LGCHFAACPDFATQRRKRLALGFARKIQRRQRNFGSKAAIGVRVVQKNALARSGSLALKDKLRAGIRGAAVEEWTSAFSTAFLR